MSLNKKILGIIFANMHENVVPELTRQRTMGSVMFGGRYRLIDFTLSNMANSGVDEVGIITKSNYQSLLDHLGSGRLSTAFPISSSALTLTMLSCPTATL